MNYRDPITGLPINFGQDLSKLFKNADFFSGIPTPPPAATPPPRIDEEARSRSRRRKKAQVNRRGFGSTILTSGLGDTSQAPVGLKKALGGDA